MPPTPIDNKKLTKTGRIKKWIKKHKTPLILTGAGIAVPAAIGGGLQADGEARQDIRDANMLEANKSLLLQRCHPLLNHFFCQQSTAAVVDKDVVGYQNFVVHQHLLINDKNQNSSERL